MKGARTPAKGVRSIRHCTGFMLWDYNVNYRAFSMMHWKNMLELAEHAMTLPGGEDAAWFYAHRERIRDIFVGRVLPFKSRCIVGRGAVSFESHELEEYWAIDPENAARILHLMGCTGCAHFPVVPSVKWDVCFQIAASMGYKPAIREVNGSNWMSQLDADTTKWRGRGHIRLPDMLKSAQFKRAIEKEALAGHLEEIWILADDESYTGKGVFWTILASPMTGAFLNKDILTKLLSQSPVEAYESGLLTNDLKYAKIKLKDDLSSMLGPSEVFFHRVNALAKTAVDAWLLVACRFRVVKDIRRLIGMMLWDLRADWAETVVSEYGGALNPIAGCWTFGVYIPTRSPPKCGVPDDDDDDDEI